MGLMLILTSYPSRSNALTPVSMTAVRSFMGAQSMSRAAAKIATNGDPRSLAPGVAWEVVLYAECSKMTLSIDSHPSDVSRRVTYLSANSCHSASRPDDTAILLKNRSTKFRAR